MLHPRKRRHDSIELDEITASFFFFDLAFERLRKNDEDRLEPPLYSLPVAGLPMLLALASLPAPRLAPGGAPSRLASPPIMQVPPMRMFEDDLIATELAPTNAPEVAADLTTVVQGGSLRTWSYDSADVEQVRRPQHRGRSARRDRRALARDLPSA